MYLIIKWMVKKIIVTLEIYSNGWFIFICKKTPSFFQVHFYRVKFSFWTNEFGFAGHTRWQQEKLSTRKFRITRKTTTLSFLPNRNGGRRLGSPASPLPSPLQQRRWRHCDHQPYPPNPSVRFLSSPSRLPPRVPLQCLVVPSSPAVAGEGGSGSAHAYGWVVRQYRPRALRQG
jgi:hypothetical protein